MKYLSFLVLLFSTAAFTQPVVKYNVATIAAMKAYFGNANEIHVDATNANYAMCNPCTANEINIFLGQGSKKWKKIESKVLVDSITLFKDSVIAASPTADLSFITATYSSTLSRAYDPLRPNFATTLSGNLSLSVTGTSSGNSGIVKITRGSGNETLTFNGNVVGSTAYPTAASSVVWMTYINDGSTINWFLGNPVTTGGSGSTSGLPIENASTFTTIGDSSTQRLVKVAADQTHGDSLRFYFHNGTSLTPILTSVAVNTPYPGAPTSGVTNDVADTFDWTHPAGYTTSDEETTINGGTSWSAASKPLSVGDVAKAIGQVGVRVKAVTGRNASAALYNTTAYTVSGGGNTSFITGQTLSTTRNDFETPGLGFRLLMGPTNITVTDLGRWIVSGNSQTHTLSIYNSSGVAIVTASLNASGKSPGDYSYVSCTPTTLVAGETYFIVSSEFSGGDLWYDALSVTHTSVGTIVDASYLAPSLTDLGVGAGKSYVPVSFKYQF